MQRTTIFRLPLTAAIYRIGFYTSPEGYRPSRKYLVDDYQLALLRGRLCVFPARARIHIYDIFVHGFSSMARFKSFFLTGYSNSSPVYCTRLTLMLPSKVPGHEMVDTPLPLPLTEIVYTLSLTPAHYVRCDTLDNKPIARQNAHAQETPPSTGNWRILQSNSLELHRKRSTSSDSIFSAHPLEGLTP
jgi:hypothetical protein